jgi:2-oxo-3-hexenedioate decarboxylase
MTSASGLEADAAPQRLSAIAAEVLEALDAARQVAPFSARAGGLTLAEAYRAAALLKQMREARGEQAVGRKIGFTNRAMWPEYRVDAPIWGYVYDTTVHNLDALGAFPLSGFAEPRIEPEIVFGLAAAPVAGMDETALLSCVAWVAHGFEIVQSIFPRWTFSAADAVAGGGVHAALLIGPRHAVAGRAAEWRDTLARFEVDLLCGGRVVDRGRGANVLDSPLLALRHLVELLARDPVNPPLAAGEVVTTGSLTRALPVAAGETWSTALAGIALDGIRLHAA